MRHFFRGFSLAVSIILPSEWFPPVRAAYVRAMLLAFFFFFFFRPSLSEVQCGCVCVCVCVFFAFILDIKFVGRTSRGHTGGRSHRISHPPSFCGACLNFSREKGSAIPFVY